MTNKEKDNILKLNINLDTYLELEKISNGSFYPLKGFMEEKDFYSVCKDMRLANGRLFPLPILLPISNIQARSIKLNDEVYLYYNKKKVGAILAKSIYKINFSEHIKDIFGVEDLNHPGYQIMKKLGSFFTPLNMMCVLLEYISASNGEIHHNFHPKENHLLYPVYKSKNQRSHLYHFLCYLHC